MQGGRSLALLAVALSLAATALAPVALAQQPLPGTTPPTADFSFAPLDPIAGQDVRFHDTSINGTKPIWLYIWSTSDGQRFRAPAVINASHYNQRPPDATFRFPEAGTYDVTLAITDRAGHQDEKTRSVTVRPGLSTSFTLVQDGANVTVDASATTSPYGKVVSYKWIWGDGTANGTGARATHRYATPGNHTLLLQVTDDQGYPGRAQRVVSVAESGPVADFRVPATIDVGRPAAFEDASAPGPFAALSSWSWKVAGAEVGTGRTLTHAFPETGTYEVSLTVTDARGLNATATRSVRVLSAPTAIFSVEKEGRSVSVDASLSADRDGRLVAYEWDWGDGSRGQGVKASHEYAAVGEYVVTLTVVDDDGARTSSNRTLELEGRPVVVAFSASSLNAKVGEAIHLLDASRDPEGDIKAWRWEFGDGQTGEGAQVTHAYAQPGHYVVNLTVTDSQGGLARASQTLTIEPKPAPTPVTSTPVVTSPSVTPATPGGSDVLTPAATTVAASTPRVGEVPAGTKQPGEAEAPGPGALAAAALAALAGLLLPRRRR